jgi:hypothetical protein
VVARGTATARGAGRITVRLAPTARAKRAARRLRGATLTITVTQGSVRRTARIRLR